MTSKMSPSLKLKKIKPLGLGQTMGCMVWRDQEQLETAQGTLRGRLVGYSPRSQRARHDRATKHTYTHILRGNLGRSLVWKDPA